ncbi:FAD-dependent oxidoreductase [Pseudolysinimonas sp.]|jgi:NADPH-dependent 2,4-dienoyl-CoA reductase/sulfur reductase-like enzyme/rhodanese-related sulfurtransferase|uniref:FAD-dependent oxidoreductase n=1 Tax=Pseudolysinimonas sp. TaxID=2680009 RepID=UPI003784EBD3
MTPRRILIVGGVAGGMSAATRLRRLLEHAEIVVFERGGHVSFANCGLPYYLGGVIDDRADLLLQTPASLAARFGLDVRVRHEVLAIDRDARTIRVRDLESGTETDEPYDALVLSPGASPVRPDLPGAERMLTLRDIDDVDAAMAALQTKPRSALVLGGGFIGLEMTENLLRRGLAVTLVERNPQVLTPLDPEMAEPVAARLRTAGVDLRLSSGVVALGADTATLVNGDTVPADLVIAATGVRPDSGLARDAGLALGPRGGIRVDDRLCTADPAIFAIGDAAEKVDALTGESRLVPLAGLANRHGRLVADAIAGREIRVRDALGTAVVGVLDLTAAVTGWNEKQLRAAGREIRVIHTHPASHTGYYPGAQPMALKLLVDARTDEILGAQGVGGEGVDKRLDVIATAMTGRLTASDLADLELAYAPQYSSAKDPVNMLGYVALNARDGLTPSIQWHELAAALDAGATLIDVRSVAEYRDGAIPGSLNIPLDDLRARLDDLPAGRLIVHCKVGQRGHAAVRLLAQHGRDAVNLDGGYLTWSAGTQSTKSMPVASAA